jgi:hypothetical protein
VNVTDLIQEVQNQGGAIWVEGERLELQVPDCFPETLIEELRDHKAEIVAALSRHTESTHLPFPISYVGLPTTQVELAEVVMDKFGITDAVLRKYNVLCWVIRYYQDREENHGEHYEAIKNEQFRLGRILDPNGNT